MTICPPPPFPSQPLVTRRVLFVCHGNLCRSPTAEAVLRRMARDMGLALDIDSAGTAVWKAGQPAALESVEAAEARGYDLSGLRARALDDSDFDRFDRIVALDRANLAVMERRRPTASVSRLSLLLSHAGRRFRIQVPDPRFTGRHEKALDLIELGCRGLIAEIAAETRAAAAQRAQ